MKKMFSILLLGAMLTAWAACGERGRRNADLDLHWTLPSARAPGHCNVMHAVYDGLVKFDTNGDIVPVWRKAGKIKRKTVFHLVQHATFSSRWQSVTADDVIFTMDLHFNCRRLCV